MLCDHLRATPIALATDPAAERAARTATARLLRRGPDVPTAAPAAGASGSSLPPPVSAPDPPTPRHLLFPPSSPTEPAHSQDTDLSLSQESAL